MKIENIRLIVNTELAQCYIPSQAFWMDSEHVAKFVEMLYKDNKVINNKLVRKVAKKFIKNNF